MKKLTLLFAAAMLCMTSFAADYSTTYTSSVTLTPGKNSQEAVLNIDGTNYDGAKAGTSKNAGEITVTVPANHNVLHFHAIAWKGLSDVVVSIKNGEQLVTEVTIQGNEKITGNPPFTLNDIADNYYFKINMPTNAEETKLTFTSSKRFVLFGVNSEASTDVPATGIELSETELELEQYKSFKLTATLTPANATTSIIWSSDNNEVATVSNGIVEVLANNGTATITATAGEFSASCVINAKEATILSCAEAAEKALTAAGNNQPVENGKYVIRGYVTEMVPSKNSTIEEDMERYGNYSFWMADVAEGGHVFEAYQVKPVDGKTIAKVGDFVEVIGDLTKYEDTPETMGKGAASVEIIENPETAIEHAETEVKAEKRFINGVLVIEKDGVLYNAQGTRL